MAAQENHLDVVKYLLDRGADHTLVTRVCGLDYALPRLLRVKYMYRFKSCYQKNNQVQRKFRNEPLYVAFLKRYIMETVL